MRRVVLIAWLSVATCAVRADAWAPESVGVRYGVSATSFDDFFSEAEAVARWRLPLDLDLGADWEMRFLADATFGYLGARGDHGVIGTLGPLLTLGRRQWRVHFEGGLSVSAISLDKFGEDVFGSHVLFIPHLGGAVDLSRHWSLGYRWQHMSNGGFSEPNPGINLHAFTLLYRF